ncbi:DUF5655 domain-containing protein [Actinomadura fulvescens]|uniref:DUF5655 domain-containing protein n=1 Tax=Actinomadura fulvescens TaxID=46160 RepID=A0ABN3PIL9_9ACTN
MPDDDVLESQLRYYFDAKPDSMAIFRTLRDLIEEQGESEMTVGAQISFGVRRKFAWIWLYNITGANPQGTVQLMLALREPVDEPPVYRTTQIGKTRWNHLVVVHSMEEARDPRLHPLVRAAYEYGAA